MTKISIKHLIPIPIISYSFGLFIPIMEIDAMQYASMSRELLRGDNFLHFFDNGLPYLDKPPLIFWTTAIFFKIFGASNFSYRLPSIIFSILTIYSTYKFSRLYYSKNIAIKSALILSSCQAFYIMNGDVKTDIYMIGPMMFAIWQFSAYLIRNQWLNIILGSIGIAFSMMGKGPLGLVIPFCLLVGDILMKNKIKLIFDIRLLFSLLIIVLLLIPMSIGLFTQFGIDGLNFFYWKQSFGRITGASSMSNDTGLFYLFNVFLYSFLPWTLIFLFAFINKIKKIINQLKNEKQFEFVSTLGFIVPLLMLSLSNFKLPHYIYCVCPFASILTASQINTWVSKKNCYKYIYNTQILVSAFVTIFIYSLAIYSFRLSISFYIIPVFLIIGFIRFQYFRMKDKYLNLFLPSILACVLGNYGLYSGILKPLLEYQSQLKAAQYIIENNYENVPTYFFNENSKAKSRSLNFHLDKDIQYIDAEFFNKNPDSEFNIVFTNEKGYNKLLDGNHQKIEVLKIFPHTRVSKINKSFINPKTRSETLKKKYLIKII